MDENFRRGEGQKISELNVVIHHREPWTLCVVTNVNGIARRCIYLRTYPSSRAQRVSLPDPILRPPPRHPYLSILNLSAINRNSNKFGGQDEGGWFVSPFLFPCIRSNNPSLSFCCHCVHWMSKESVTIGFGKRIRWCILSVCAAVEGKSDLLSHFLETFYNVGDRLVRRRAGRQPHIWEKGVGVTLLLRVSPSATFSHFQPQPSFSRAVPASIR